MAICINEAAIVWVCKETGEDLSLGKGGIHLIFRNNFPILNRCL